MFSNKRKAVTSERIAIHRHQGHEVYYIVDMANHQEGTWLSRLTVVVALGCVEIEVLFIEVLLRRNGPVADNETMFTLWPEMNVTDILSKQNPGDRYQDLG